MSCPCALEQAECDCKTPDRRRRNGDSRYFVLLDELRDLHALKSGSYGTARDPMANFIAVASASGQHPSRYAFERLVEKATRAINLIDAGRRDEIDEGLDCAGLALCAEVLLRRDVK